MTDRAKSHGLHPALAGMSEHRHELGKFEQDFAREKRGKGWGWQAIARALKVNEIDLRRHCGDLEIAAALTAHGGEARLSGRPATQEVANDHAAEAEPKIPRAADLRPILRDGPTYQVLKVLIEAPATAAGISSLIGRPEQNVLVVLGKLVVRRLAVRRGAAELWSVTPAGVKVFEAARDAVRSPVAGLTQIERVLLAIIDGDRTSAEVSRRLSITVANASGALHALTNTGHLRAKAATARSNLWVPTVKGRERAEKLRADLGAGHV